MATPTPTRSGEVKLAIAAAKLKRAVPEYWNEFSEALAEVTTEQTTDLLQSAGDAVRMHQGRAQFCAYLKSILDNCLHTADKKAK